MLAVVLFGLWGLVLLAVMAILYGHGEAGQLEEQEPDGVDGG